MKASDPSEPADLQDAILDDEALGQLVFDIGSCARVLEVRIKGGPMDYAREGAITLERAVVDLRAGKVVGVQVRYLHQGAEWCDTLLRVPGGVRLVRMGKA